MRCKNILWMLLYSAERQQYEAEKTHSDHCSAVTAIEKYIRTCTKSGSLKQWHIIRSLIRNSMKQTVIDVWVPPLHIMEPLLFHYAKLITKFFWVILGNTTYGTKHATDFPFDYFVLASVNILKHRGLSSKSVPILAFDAFMNAQMPDPNILPKFGVHIPTVTKVRNNISTAVSQTNIVELKVSITEQDPALFYQARMAHQWQQKENATKSKEAASLRVGSPSPFGGHASPKNRPQTKGAAFSPYSR